MDRGRPCLISAPSGAGKTTIVRQLVGMLPRLVHSVSYTTRPIRSGERDGRDYHFVDQETFDAMVARDAFVEWAVVHGQQYGTPRDPLERWLANGTDVLLDLDVIGGRALRKAYPETLAIFVMPPSRAALADRLRQRGTEDAAAMEKRLKEADREMAARDEYHHVVVNDSVESVCQAVARLLLAHRQGD